MLKSELKSIQPASVFALFFSAVFIVGLVYLLAAVSYTHLTLPTIYSV